MAKETTADQPAQGHQSIWGYDAVNDQWRAINVDASGLLQVDIAAAEQLECLTHQYDGAAWRKSNLLWGYHDTVSEQIENTNLDAGTNILSGTAVPEGKVWVVTAIAARVDSAVITALYGGCTVGAAGVNIISAVPPTTQVWYPTSGQFVLKEGDYVHAYIFGAAAGDNGYLRYLGYEMDIEM